MKWINIAMIACSLQAVTLKELIIATLEHNQNIKSYSYTNLSQKHNAQSVSNIYNPNIVVGANYNKLSMDMAPTQIGEVTNTYAKFSINLYNGGKNRALKQQKQYQYKSSAYHSTTLIKQTLLDLVNMYFNLKTTNDNIEVYKEKSKALKAQYERVKIKYNMKMTTIDEVLKLQSEYESNLYNIDELLYQKQQLIRNILLISGIKVDTLDTKTLPDLQITYTPSSNIKALEYTLKSNQANVEVVRSNKKPAVQLTDTVNFYSYSDYNSQLVKDLPHKQNQLAILVTYDLFDTSTNHKIESAKMMQLATANQLAFAKNQEKMEFVLAKEKIKTQLLKIKSLQSAVQMANSVYNIIKAKYENGVVDNITYLDALSKKIYNLALYKKALNDLEIAKANYYFKSGINYKEVLHKF
ncbi:MAG: TolC family protein [Epsilonproteobacteria bacterium]|nr:TolC family protein [Campylobacterota bacterium]